MNLASILLIEKEDSSEGAMHLLLYILNMAKKPLEETTISLFAILYFIFDIKDFLGMMIAWHFN